jgi:hypothetical protein
LPIPILKIAGRISKDEASWFSRRCKASSGDGIFWFAPFATASLELGLLGRLRLLTMTGRHLNSIVARC